MAGKAGKWLFGWAVAIVGLIAGLAFALAYGGNWDYMVRVAGYSRGTGWMGPAVVEGLLVVTFLALAVLTTAPKRVRFQLWVIFLTTNVASVAGNVLDAMDKQMRWEGVVTRGLWPLATVAGTSVVVSMFKWQRTRPTVKIPEGFTAVINTDRLPGIPDFMTGPGSPVVTKTRPGPVTPAPGPGLPNGRLTLVQPRQGGKAEALDRLQASVKAAGLTLNSVAQGNTRGGVSKLSDEDKAAIRAKVGGAPLTKELVTELQADYPVSAKTLRRALDYTEVPQTYPPASNTTKP